MLSIADGVLPAMESIKATENHNVGGRLFNAKEHGEKMVNAVLPLVLALKGRS